MGRRRVPGEGRPSACPLTICPTAAKAPRSRAARRAVACDASHAFSHGFHPRHSERLASNWGEALGGPATYSAAYGIERSVVRMHSGNGPHEEMDRRGIACFDRVLTDVGLADGRVRQVLYDYFTWATATTMSRAITDRPTTCLAVRVPTISSAWFRRHVRIR